MTRGGKVIILKLCKKLKFDYFTKWYIHKPESVLENKSHKILWDFELQTDDRIGWSTKKKELVE